MAVSKTRAVLNALNNRLPTPLPVGRGCIYVPHPTHFARGVTIEQTPYKDNVYVRHLRVAFFRELPFVSMDNSPRLVSKLTSEHGTGFEGGPETIADQIMGAIERERLHHDLSVLPEPAEFLDIIRERRLSRSAELDRPCCHILLGENDVALKLLTERVARNEDYRPSKTTDAEMALALALIETLDRGEDAAAELRRRCHANALALGFSPAPLPIA